MPEKINLEEIKKQYPEFFKKISPELLEFILSEKISSKIAEICLENGVVNEEKIEKIAYQTALVLLGQRAEESLPKILETEEGLNREITQKISISIRRFIFSEIPKIQESQRGENQLIQPLTQPPATAKKEKTEAPPEKDNYRESAE